MAKMTLNELKLQIAHIIEEAKKTKKSKKSSKRSSKSSKRHSPQVEAFGHYDEEHDFSKPLGAYNLYRQQGAVNWGPYTSSGPHLEYNLKEGDEKALRTLVREIIENGLVDESSAWAPFISKAEPLFESSWDEVMYRLTEKAWYDKKDDKEHIPGKPAFEKTKYKNVHRKPGNG